MDTNTLEALSEQTIMDTQAGLDSVSKEVVFVNTHFLDGPFNKALLIQRCREHAHIVAERYLLLGRDLLALKANCDHGEWHELLDDIGIKSRQAQSFMRVAVKYNKPALLGLTQRLSVSKLIELADEDDEDLEGLLNGGQLNEASFDAIEKMTVRELKAALRKSQQAMADEKATYEKMIADKNKHADGLTKTLAHLQNNPVIEDWPGHVAETAAMLTADGIGAQQALLRVLAVMEARHTLEMPDASKKHICAAYIHEVNALSELVGQMQDFVNRAFPQFVDMPSHVMTDSLALVDGD